MQFIEVDDRAEPVETTLGEFPTEGPAVELVRAGRSAFSRVRGRRIRWWVVRQHGAALADFVADSKSHKEFVLDIRSSQFVEV